MAGEIIGKRYAEAIYEVAKENNSLKKTHENLMLVVEAFEKSSEFSMIMLNPNISMEQKKDVMKKIFEESVEKEILNIFMYLIECRRLEYINDIARAYLTIFYEENSIVEVKGTFATTISSEQSKKLIEKLEKFTSKKIELTTEVDKSIIGGGILQIGDKIIDGSLRRQFELLKSNL